MIHWDCPIGHGCPLLDGAKMARRIDQPLSPETGIACDKCWRAMHGQLPLVRTTSDDLQQYADGVDAEPTFLRKLREQQAHLSELPPAA